MIFGNRVAKMKLVEQLTLVTLQTAHHGSTSPRIASTQRNHASRPVSTDFCSKIGTNRTSPFNRRRSAFEGGFNRSAQHSNLLTRMECGHEAATSHLLFCGSAV